MHCTEEDAEIRDVSSEDEMPGIENDAADDSSYNSDGGSSQNSDFEAGVGAAGKFPNLLVHLPTYCLTAKQRRYDSMALCSWHRRRWEFWIRFR